MEFPPVGRLKAAGTQLLCLACLCGALLATLGLAGCASSRDTRAAGEPPRRDTVLWQYRQGATALRQGRFEDAIRSFDEALTTISAIRTQDKDARRARGYFSPEATKTFLGEPYERVMAWYYRGILYWMQGELDNARACFRSAQIQDADTENRQYASDYVLLDFLDGLATEKLGGDGSDAFKRAQGLLRRGTLPAATRDDNVLIFAEYGRGPVKYATGAYGEQLRFRPGNSVAHAAVLRLAGRELRLDPLDDLHFQATTRGGRVMDHILANKAVFKSATDTAGDVAVISGAVLATGRDTHEAGLGLLAFGLLSKIVSASTVPAADTRYWHNLPQYLSFAALRLPPGDYSGTVEFLDAQGRVAPRLTRNVTFTVSDPRRDMVVFISDQDH